MDFRSLAAIMIVVCSSGCEHIGQQRRVNYRTIQASPHRNSEWAQTETNQADAFLQKGHLDKAEQSLQLALVADVSYGPAHNNLGQVYLLQGNYYLAAWEFEYAIRLMPDRPEPFNNLGLVYEQAGKLDEAIGFFESAHELQRDDPQYLGNLVRCHLRRGDRDEQTLELLSDLVMRETRPEWSQWAQAELALFKVSSGNPSSHSPATSGQPSAEVLPPPIPLPSSR